MCLSWSALNKKAKFLSIPVISPPNTRSLKSKSDPSSSATGWKIHNFCYNFFLSKIKKKFCQIFSHVEQKPSYFSRINLGKNVN